MIQIYEICASCSSIHWIDLLLRQLLVVHQWTRNHEVWTVHHTPCTTSPLVAVAPCVAHSGHMTPFTYASTIHILLLVLWNNHLMHYNVAPICLTPAMSSLELQAITNQSWQYWIFCMISSTTKFESYQKFGHHIVEMLFLCFAGLRGRQCE